MKPQAQPDTDAEAPPYVFTRRELGRLTVYRAAVLAGFYNEHAEEQPADEDTNP